MPLFKLSDGQVHFSSLLITFSTTEICIEIYKCIFIDRTISQYPKLYCFKDVFFSIRSFLLSLFWRCPYLLHFRRPLKCIPRRRRSIQTSTKAGDPPNAQGDSNNKTSWLYVSIPQNLFSVSKNPFCCVFSEMNFRSCSQPKYPPKKWFTNNSAPLFRVKTAPTPTPPPKRRKKNGSKLHPPPVRKLPCSRVTVLRQTRYPIVAPSPGLRKQLGLNRMNDLDQIAYELCTEYIYTYTVCI